MLKVHRWIRRKIYSKKCGACLRKYMFKHKCSYGPWGPSLIGTPDIPWVHRSEIMGIDPAKLGEDRNITHTIRNEP